MGEETRPAPRARVVTRRHIIEMLVVGAIASAAGIALGIAIDWFPMQGSVQAAPIDTLWDVLVIVSVPIFVLVTVIVIWSVRLFKQRPGEEGLDGPPIHGSTRLEVIWTALPAILLIALCGYAWAVLVEIEEAPADNKPELAERRIAVMGEQFAWSFKYKEGGKEFTSNRLYLPAGEPVRFDVISKDVLHDFWIPDFRMKIDAVPGVVTGFRVTPLTNALGEHEIVCAELCGIGHAYMRQTAVVQPPGEFAAWVRRMTTEQPADDGGEEQQALTAEDGKELYVTGKPDTGAIACGTCHTLADANTTAETGPNLDEVLQGQDAAAIKDSIVNPNGKLTDGFGEGIMPANYGDTLTGAEVDALVDYLVEATK
jgi:cytochrome c oxidase subunit II